MPEEAGLSLLDEFDRVARRHRSAVMLQHQSAGPLQVGAHG
jgi:hypothetical protein